MGIAIGGEAGPGEAGPPDNGPGNIPGVDQSANAQSGFTLFAKQCAEIQGAPKTYGEKLMAVCQAIAKLKLIVPRRVQQAALQPVPHVAPQPALTAASDPTPVNYDQVFYTLIDAMKTQQTEFELHDASIAALEAEVKMLKAAK